MGLSHLAMVRPHPSVDLVGMCDASGYTLGVLEKYTGVKAFKDFHAFVSDVEMDAIFISTPSTTHAWMVKAALEKGLHVFCEKPFTLTKADAEAAVDEVRRAGVTLGLGYNRAAKIVETMEKRGLVGPANGAKDREIFIEQI